jgi:hypothetical protein
MICPKSTSVSSANDELHQQFTSKYKVLYRSFKIIRLSPGKLSPHLPFHEWTDRAWLDPSLAGESFREHELAPANCRHRQL